jgi:CDP-diacylglycerol--serine O-phosphatidyltransferase
MRHSTFAWAGFMIFIAMIADMLDGRVARISQTTSSFGGQLDSMCDMISFGVAPAFLALRVLDYSLVGLLGISESLAPFVLRFVWVACGLYLVCSAIRLARFNVENEDDETYHFSFAGLPTPAAAGVIASIVVFVEMLMRVSETGIFASAEHLMLYLLPFAAIGVSLLMISRIPYPHLVNKYLRGRKPFSYMIWLVVIIGLIYWSVQSSLLIIFCGYAIMGFVQWSWSEVRKLTMSSTDGEPNVMAVTSGGGDE